MPSSPRVLSYRALMTPTRLPNDDPPLVRPLPPASPSQNISFIFLPPYVVFGMSLLGSIGIGGPFFEPEVGRHPSSRVGVHLFDEATQTFSLVTPV